MKTFREYLAEAEQEQEAASIGTYASVLPCDKNKEKLHKFISKLELKNAVPMDEYHCTVIYSRKRVSEVEGIKPTLPITATVKGWDVFGDCLVLTLTSPGLLSLNSKCMDLGATSDFESYKPHITVATEYTGEVPSVPVPKMKLSFDQFVVEDLKED